MTRSNCHLVHEHWNGFIDDSVDEVKRDFIEQHLAECSNCQEFYKYKEGLVDLVNNHPVDPILRRRLEIGIHQKSSGAETPQKRARLIPAHIAATSAGAALVIGAIFFFAQSHSSLDGPELSETPAITKTVNQPDPRRDSGIELLSTVNQTQSIEVTSGTTLWLAKDTSVEIVEKSNELARFFLKQGRVVASIENHNERYRFIIETPQAEIEAHGTIFSVEVNDGAELARVTEGVVIVRLKGDDKESFLEAGKEIALAEPSIRPAKEESLKMDLCAVNADRCASKVATARHFRPSSKRPESGKADPHLIYQRIDSLIKERSYDEAETLLFSSKGKQLSPEDQIKAMVRLARTYRQSRLYKKARETYERMAIMFPNSRTATNGLVALAQMEQDELKDPALALKHFNQYLRKQPTGSLSEAAYAGKVRALFQMEMYDKTIRAADEYLKAYRSGYSVTEIERKRKTAMERLNQQGSEGHLIN